MVKFEFRKSDKFRMYQLVSSPETHEKNQQRLLGPLDTESDMIIIWGVGSVEIQIP